MVVMNTRPHQLLMLLLCLVGVNLPSCSSLEVLFPRRPRLFAALREARREANSGLGAWHAMDSTDRLANAITRTAAKQAHVTATKLLQAYVKVRSCRDRPLRELRIENSARAV